MLIEKQKPGTFFNALSQTTIVNDDCDKDSSSSSLTPSEENLARWKTLIDNFDSMTTKEKFDLFLPYLHYINLRDIHRQDFDQFINDQIVEGVYNLCRDFDRFKFDPDRQGAPNLILVFKPININMIPDSLLKAKMKAFGLAFGLIKNCDTCNCDC